jgi:hypothetical protein
MDLTVLMPLLILISLIGVLLMITTMKSLIKYN